MKIKKGYRFVCIKDVYLNGDGEHLYKKGNIYLSERDSCITDESGDKHHCWDTVDYTKEYFIPYSQLDKVYTKATPLLNDIFDKYEGKKHKCEGEIIWYCNCDSIDITGCLWADIIGGDYSTEDYYNDNSYTYLSESAFIEFMDLGKYVTSDVKLYNSNHTKVQVNVEDVVNFKQITDSLASLLEHKNKNYGNSALEPLKIFGGKSTVGTRVDDKLARIKNSEELRMNDIADILGYLVLICKEKGWNNFDSLKD